MSNTELQHELDAALDDAELLARNQISGAIQYLAQGQRFSVAEIRELVTEILDQMNVAPERPRLQVVAGTRHVN